MTRKGKSLSLSAAARTALAEYEWAKDHYACVYTGEGHATEVLDELARAGHLVTRYNERKRAREYVLRAFA